MCIHYQWFSISWEDSLQTLTFNCIRRPIMKRKTIAYEISLAVFPRKRRMAPFNNSACVRVYGAKMNEKKHESVSHVTFTQWHTHTHSHTTRQNNEKERDRQTGSEKENVRAGRSVWPIISYSALTLIIMSLVCTYSLLGTVDWKVEKTTCFVISRKF